MIKKILHELFQALFVFIFFYIYLLMIEKMVFTQEILAFFISILFFIGLCILYRHLNIKHLMPLLLIVMTILLLYCGYSLQFTPVADLGNLYKMARNFAITGSMRTIYKGVKMKYYLSIYPNNDFLFLILACYFRVIYLITGLIPTTIAGILLNIGVIDISYYLTYKLTQKLLDDHSADFVCLLFVLFSPFYFYVTFYYTDTLAMPLMLLSLYLYIKGGKYNLFSSLLCAFFAYKMKGNMLLLIAVMIIYTALSKPLKKTLLYILSSILIFGILSFGFSSVIYMSHISSKQLEERYKVPLNHWIGMSLIGNGGYRKADYKEIAHAGHYAQKQKAATKRIQKILNSYTPFTFYKHCKNKITYTWCDGTYFAVNQTYYYPIKHNTIKNPEHMLHEFMISSFYISYADMYQCFLLLSFILFVIYKRNSIEPMLLVQGMLLGSVVFFLLWETRSRYILSLVPLMLILATSTIKKISSAL